LAARQESRIWKGRAIIDEQVERPELLTGLKKNLIENSKHFLRSYYAESEYTVTGLTWKNNFECRSSHVSDSNNSASA
jgi:hypothetical protein